MSLSRYHRQEILPEVGASGQARLSNAHAMVVGCGALGCVVSEWLVRAGVGTVTILDRDLVEHTNLQRQTLFTEQDAREGVPKPIAARQRLSSVNSEVKIRALCEDLHAGNAEELVCDVPDAPPVGVIVDGTDSFETRYLLNDLSVSANIPMVYAGVVGTRGTTMTILPGRGPCLRCVVETPPDTGITETCDTAGVLGPAVGVLASIEACEALKILLGAHDSCSTDLVRIDLWSNAVQHIDVSNAKCDDCPCCGLGEFEFLENQSPTETRTLCGRDSVQITPAVRTVDLSALASKLRSAGSVVHDGDLLRSTLSGEVGERGESLRLVIFPTGRAIISGTTDQARARSIFARYVGV